MWRLSLIFLLVTLFGAANLLALPVSLGSLDIGLESSDGYQEGRALLSTDETGENFEILLAYRGFGLDTITWTFQAEDFAALRNSVTNAAWWRSRLLEITVNQKVSRETATVAPSLVYAYRENRYPFDSVDDSLQFVRQGKDYALLLTENSPGADTRKSGEKSLPVFTLHFLGPLLPDFRNRISESNMSTVLTEFAEQKAAIDGILSAAPES